MPKNSEKKSPLIALEGLDGVGKSTVIELLKNQHNFEVYGTPPPELKHLRSIYDQPEISLTDRFLYYLAGIVLLGNKIEPVSDKPIFSDRHILTTLSAHEAMGLARQEIEKTLEAISGLRYPMLTILLTVSEEEKQRRLEGRGLNENDQLNLTINDKILAGYFSWAEQLQLALVELDTSDLTPQEVTQEVIHLAYNEDLHDS